jgi:hypothetical protein|tara:strand:+ start:25319 stop:25672 length:354 start_codon:yes stop_codon:yes gene_type:complete
MKISKARLIEIIKEEVSAVSEVHSEKQRNYMCAMADEGADRPAGLSKAEADEMCSGPMKETVKFSPEKAVYTTDDGEKKDVIILRRGTKRAPSWLIKLDGATRRVHPSRLTQITREE